MNNPLNKIDPQVVWDMNWTTHALVNVMTREAYAKRFPSPKPLPEFKEDDYDRAAEQDGGDELPGRVASPFESPDR